MSQVMKDGFLHGSASDIGPRIEMMLKGGQQVILQVSGDSMRPTLKPGRDAVVLDAMTEWPPKRGDILFYRTDIGQSGYAMHRVKKVTDKGPIMNGDAQTWVEGPIAQEQVLAKGVALLRKGQPFDIEKQSYRTYVRLWSYTRPIRRPLFAIWRGIKKVIGR